MPSSRTRYRWMLVGLGTLTVALAIGFAATARTLGQHQNSDHSMLPGLRVGDRLILGRTDAGSMPRRGDIVLVHRTSDPSAGSLRRVMAVPGEHVAMRGSRPVINGWLVPACDAGYYAYVTTGTLLEGKVWVEWLGGAVYLTLHGPGAPGSGRVDRVRPGEVFVLSDNRSDANDSRTWNDGEGDGVSLDDIQGRVQRMLLGRQGERWEWRQLLAPLSTRLSLQGVDVSELEAGIRRCLESPPVQTTPPSELQSLRCGDKVIQAGEECDDGNQLPGDGCDRHCLSELPPCAACTERVAECQERQAACSSPACAALLRCAEQTQCAADASQNCYTRDCTTQVESAAGATDPGLIAQRFIDPATDLGGAMRLIACRRAHCANECGLTP